MVNKSLLLSLLFIVVSCNKYSAFDELYYTKQYNEAYKLLKNKPSNSLSYQERELKVLLFLSIQETSTYLPLLDNALLKNHDLEELKAYHDLARGWIRFISAETREDYEAVFEQIPKMPFKERKIEHLRLLIQTHALVNLGQQQEAIAYLQASDLTKYSSDLIYIKALSHNELNQNESAKKEFSTLIKTTDNNELKAIAYFHLGNIANDEQQFNQAEKYYLKSWELDPYNAQLNFQIGKIFQKKSFNDLHYRFYRASLRLNENIAEAWYRLNI